MPLTLMEMFLDKGFIFLIAESVINMVFLTSTRPPWARPFASAFQLLKLDVWVLEEIVNTIVRTPRFSGAKIGLIYFRWYRLRYSACNRE